jgi:putative membrane protein
MKAKCVLITVAAASALLSGCAMMESNAQVSPVDQHFMLNAMSVGIAEIEMGQLAMQQSQDAAVQRYGRHMVEDHTRVNAELQQVADAKHVKLLKAMDPANHLLYSELKKQSGPAFDREYMRAQINIHSMGNGLYESETKHGEDLMVRDFAARNTPVGIEHLKMAQQMAR